MATQFPVIAPHKHAYDEVAEIVRGGVLYGWHRAHKYQGQPTPAQIQDAIVEAVLADLDHTCEFRWARDDMRHCNPSR